MIKACVNSTLYLPHMFQSSQRVQNHMSYICYVLDGQRTRAGSKARARTRARTRVGTRTRASTRARAGANARVWSW